MAQSTSRNDKEELTIELLRDLLIVQLIALGVPQQSIRAIVRCDLNRVTRTAKHLKKVGRREGA